MKTYYIPVFDYRDGVDELEKLIRLRAKNDIWTVYNQYALYYRGRNFVVHFVPISNLDRWLLGRRNAIEVSSAEKLNEAVGEDRIKKYY